VRLYYTRLSDENDVVVLCFFAAAAHCLRSEMRFSKNQRMSQRTEIRSIAAMILAIESVLILA